MRHVASPSRRPITARRSRAVFTALVSLALVIGALPSSAATTDDPQPSQDEVEALLREAVETPDASDDAPTDDDASDDTTGDDDASDDAAADDATADAEVSDGATPGDGASDGATADASDGEAADAAQTVAAAAAPAADIGPMFVPPGDPGPGEAKLIVRAGGDRTGTGDTSTTATPLAGATFDIFRVTEEPPVGETPDDVVLVDSCTTDATGECGAFVDLPGDLGGVDLFYAVQTGAPAGWVAPVQWGIGSDYIFATGAVDAAAPVSDRIVELPGPFNDTVTDPSWPSVRPNPLAAPQCGLDMALIMDLSNSVTETDALLDQYKDAANGFVEALVGTPSQVALYTFATSAPAAGSTNGGMPLTSVATAAGAAELTTHIDGYAQPTAGNGGTNWDRGLHQVAESSENYDVVLFVTDGQPTFHRDRQGPGDVSTIAEVNEAILSANAVKATGSQLILVGIGPEAFLPGADIRIPLISGPTEDVDFYRADYDELATTLEEIATANCAGTLTVVKEVEEADGDIVAGGAGWTFTTDTPDVTPVSATTDASSAVNFDVGFPGTSLAQAVTVTETPQDGYELEQVGGQNAVCTSTVTGAPVPVTDSGLLGFTVDVEADDIVTCTVRNLQIPPDYDDLVVTTTAETSFARDYDWVIDKVARQDRVEVPAGVDPTFTYDVTVTPSPAIDMDFTVDGTITVTNPNDVPVTGVDIDLDDLPGGVCTLTDGSDVTVAANGTHTASYSCDLPGAGEGTAGTSSVTASWDVVQLPGTTGAATATADFDFADAEISVTDAAVVVSDTEISLVDYDDGVQVGNVVTVVSGPAVFTYSMPWPGVAGECTSYDNTASIVSSGPGTVDESSTEIVTVCSGSDLDVSKNVVHSFDRTYLWTIDKVAEETVVAVDPATGTATFDYTVNATPVANGWSDSGWAMTGTITVENPNEWLDITADITDAVDVGGGADCDVTDGTGAVVPAGTSIELDYVCTFTSQPADTGTNTATASWADTVPTPSSTATGTAAVSADGWAVDPINDVITVIDDKTDPANPVLLGTATWNDTATATPFTYSVVQQVDAGQCVDFTNTAWIDETQQSAQQVVTACAAAPPVVTTTVEASYDRLFEWDIDKSVDDTDVEVDENGRATFSYLVEAVPAGFADSGWELSGSITVENPNTFTDGAITVDVTDTTDVGGLCTVEGVATAVTVPPGATQTFDYSCTFTEEPDYEGTNTATVTWAAPGGDAAEVTETVPVTFTQDVVTDLTVEVWDDKTDPANPDFLGEADWNDPTTHAFAYEVTQQGVGGQCVDFTNTAWLELAAGTGAEASTSVELCVESPLTHDKTAVYANQLTDGQWQVRYEIEVVNDALFEAAYTLSDTLEFGGGIVPTGAAWFPAGNPAAGGMWAALPGDTTVVLATARPIAAGDSHTYVVVVDADAASGVVASETGQCSGADGTDGGGFLNAATLTTQDQDVTVRDCLEPAAPVLEKSAVGVTDAGDGTWHVQYVLTATNPSADQDLYYSLTDEPGLAGGVGIVLAELTAGAGSPTANPDWDGDGDTTVVEDQLIAGGQVHTFTIDLYVDLSGEVADADRACSDATGAGAGLFNSATLTSGADDDTDDACIPAPTPQIELDKSAVDAVQNADGSWTVTYDVRAGNLTSIGGAYDLTDTLELGAGITPSSASWSLVGTSVTGEWDDPDTDPTAVLATGRHLDGDGEHHYEVTVVADVTAGVIGSAAAQCSGDDGTDGGGFLNTATLTAYGDPVTAADCLEPSLPELDKLFGSAVQQDDASWDVTYSLVVDNSGNASPAFYDLDDAPAFAAGVTVVGQSVVDVTDPAAPVDITWDGTSAIVEGAVVPAGETHSYEVTFDVEVSAGIPAANLTCDSVGEGYGFYNSATLTTGPDTLTDEDCGDITEAVVPSVAKTVADGSPVQNPDGTWTIEYDITVTTPQANTLAARYQLTDVLDFGGGISVLDATVAAGPGTPAPLDTWTGIAPTTDVTAGDVTLAADTTHTYTVTVQADVDAGVIGTDAGQCYTGQDPQAGGFLNTVTLTTDGIERVDDACAEPVGPAVQKRVLDGPTANDDGTYDVTYAIDVVNQHDDQAVTYDLADELLHLAEGVVVTSATAERDGTVYGDWDGITETQVVAGVELPAGAIHTYTVTVTVDVTGVTAPAGEGVRECGLNGSNRGQGVYNEAVVTSGNDDYDDEACVPVPDPSMEVDKTALSADQLPDGTWQVVYEVVAANPSAVGGVYDLSDTLEFGDGLTPLSAEWSLAGTDVEGAWNLPDELSAELAADRPLAGGAQDTYTVTVVADVAQGVIQGLTGQGACTGEDGTSGGGFLNAATILAHGVEDTDRDCGQPTHQTFAKVFEAATEQDDGSWAVTYTLVVDNTAHESRTYYDLSDEPHFAEGVTILDQRVMDVSDPAAPAAVPWDGESAIVETVAIEGGDVHRYEVTFDVEVADDAPQDGLTCDPVGAGHGYFNTAALVSGNDTLADEACGPATGPQPTPWTLSKTSDPVSGSEVDPGDVVEYTLRATPTGDGSPTSVVVRDDLTEVLEHASPIGDLEVSTGVMSWDGEVLVWEIGTLDETATLSYSVVVDDDAWDVTLVNVATGSGSTPPTCVDDCSTTHTTPPEPRLPGLPTTGAEVRALAVAAFILTLGGLVLMTTRRRRAG